MKKVKFTLDNAQRSPYNALCTVVVTVIRLIMADIRLVMTCHSTGIRRAKEQEQELHRELGAGSTAKLGAREQWSKTGARQWANEHGVKF